MVKLLVPCTLAPGGRCSVSADLDFTPAGSVQSAEIGPCLDCSAADKAQANKSSSTQSGKLSMKKPTRSRLPSQPDIIEGCVLVKGIHSHALNIFSGVGAPEPGIDAMIFNGCRFTVMLSLTIGYFDSNGLQFGNGYEFPSVASGATFALFHQASLYGWDKGRLKTAKIIAVAGNIAQ
jgi:hypothetical protein